LLINRKNPDGAFSNIGTVFYEGGRLGYGFRAPNTPAVNLHADVATSRMSVLIAPAFSGR